MGLNAKKSLGQNFLTDKNILHRIASLLEINSDDKVVEIGPGHGELTEEILGSNPKSLSVIEKDSDLWQILTDKFSDNKAFSLEKGDALELLPKIAPKKGDWKIAGNIPYYITGHLFRIIGDLDNPPSLSVFTTQREVTERACSLPPEMNLLAASLGIWAKAEMAGIIKKGSFRPVPKVDSAIIVLRKKDTAPKDKEPYYEMMRIIFKQPRKTVLNNLSAALGKDKALSLLDLADIDPSLRPQNLSVEDIIRLLK